MTAVTPRMKDCPNSLDTRFSRSPFSPNDNAPFLGSTPAPRIQVYAAGGSSTPGPKLSRLAALLERSPDTLAQLSRQDQVSRRQKRAQENEKREENAAQHQQQGGAGGKDEAGVGAGGGGLGLPADGRGPPVLIFVAGDRSQVRLWANGGSCCLRETVCSHTFYARSTGLRAQPAQ